MNRRDELLGEPHGMEPACLGLARTGTGGTPSNLISCGTSEIPDQKIRYIPHANQVSP
jgi:hypothetical protein